ncbi:MAG TPA: hypothetical protein VG326_02715 [Tepidisphaeraceae bacterium]|jgi:hypothetical protein|nr:hypothetical protein [Tepidisphaeraceae bacterium]
MTRSHRNRPLIYALYANAALLFAILAVLISRGGSMGPSAFGAPMTPQPIAGNGSLYLMPGQLLNNVWGCYILDTDNQTLCTYAYNGNQLRLMAARSIRYDHAMGNYNTHPDPDEIRKLVEIEREKARGLTPPATQPTAQP